MPKSSISKNPAYLEQLALSTSPIVFSKTKNKKISIHNRYLDQKISDPPEFYFYMVVVEDEDGIRSPKIKHETYEEALEECVILLEKTKKNVFVLKAISRVEQI
jgi:hypothetical protein